MSKATRVETERKKQEKKKRESNNSSTSSSRPTIPLSTERVRKHRENKRLLVNLNFNHSFTSTRRTRYLATKMKSTLNSVSLKSKRSSLSQLINRFSTNTKLHIASEINVPESHSSRMDMSVYNDIKKRRDRLSNYTQKLLLKFLFVTTKHKGIHRQSLRKSKLDETADIPKHYKTA